MIMKTLEDERYIAIKSCNFTAFENFKWLYHGEQHAQWWESSEP